MRAKRVVLEEKKIKEKRKRYFNEADRLRALGESVKEAFPDAKDPGIYRPVVHSARAYFAINSTKSIADFIYRDDLSSEARQRKFVNIIFEFLAHRPTNTDYMFKDIVKEASGIALY